MLHGIVLAGGMSSRVGTNKMLLDFDGLPVIYHVIKNMSEICTDVTIVTGHYQDDYLSLFKNQQNIRIVHNNEYHMGMFSSVKKGIADLFGPILIIPGDYPMVKAATYHQFLEIEGEIRVPVYQGRKGHPIFFSEKLVEDLKKEPITSNLKAFRNKYQVTYFETNDQGVILDIDNMKDYQNMVSKERNDICED